MAWPVCQRGVAKDPYGLQWHGCLMLAGVAGALFLNSGCVTTGPLDFVRNGFKVGPNYGRPPAPVAKQWIDAADVRVRQTPDDLSKWWTVFNDPALDGLICAAYQQNLTLRQAGFRVLQARAELGIAVGTFFPQTQQATGDYQREALSRETANKQNSAGQRFFSQWDFGFGLAWELDFWGRFRRAIEAADDSLDASVENYDDVLVTLLGDVASNYVNLRTFQRRIKFANDNIKLQRQALNIAEAQLKGGQKGSLNVEHTRSILAQTESLVPQLQISRRQANNRLCILLGIPPEELEHQLQAAEIPKAPPEAVVGIPADLLRRRPDVRRAERQAAAQCAAIGIAESDFYPRISITGNFGYSAEEFKNLFRSSALNGTIGPSFKWEILNYGRILNNVRVQDALFQQAVVQYQNTVLTANEEVEDGLATFLRSQEQVRFLAESVDAAEKAYKTALDLFKAGFGVQGASDFTQGLVLLQNLVQQQDSLAQAQGNVALGLIQIYRALGGGWQIRLTGCDVDHARPARLESPEYLPPPRSNRRAKAQAAPPTPVGIGAQSKPTDYTIVNGGPRLRVLGPRQLPCDRPSPLAPG
jgi:NodT family efflux transporter outer membrane factor (OMF) lipoprotein